MRSEREPGSDSLEELEQRHAELVLLEEEEGDEALDRLIEQMAEQEPVQREAEPGAEPPELGEREFTCRACHLIFSRSCIADAARMLCTDCARLARGAPGDRIPHVVHVHHPCPACGAMLMVPEREEVTCGFFCPSCHVHLTRREGHLHLVWNHREAASGEEVGA